MRALILATVVGVMSLGSLALTPAQVNAREWRSDGDTVAVARWRGGTGWRTWRGGSRYYYPRYWGGASYYYTPSYNYTPAYDYYYNPWVYNGYYYSPSYVVPSYRYYYRPGVRVFWGW